MPATKTKARRPAPRQRRRTPSRRTSLPWAAAGLAVLVTAAVLIARLASDDDDTSPGASGDDPGVAHVHGLGINPADGLLYVATHYGTFRILESGPAERVGDSYQDTMGFTVVGADRFVGSGHPDAAGLREGQPGLLGLIESTDGGESWTSVALSGQVDFHALAYAHDHIYGWDSTSQRFMISTDGGGNWDGRSTLALYGFAVDPDDADRLVAAAPDGLRHSSDGGRSWSEPAEPGLVTVAWDAGGTLFGVEASGAVQRSTDGGDTWEGVGRLPGSPQSLLAADGDLWAAAHGDGNVTGIYRSTDGGVTWALRYRDGDD
ncbi:MAG: F510_1955 family glycosylhydrolase [Acidimicrobiales bacterium]